MSEDKKATAEDARRSASPKTDPKQTRAVSEGDEPPCTICGLRSCWREPGAPGR
jgi:hypothetical protein